MSSWIKLVHVATARGRDPGRVAIVLGRHVQAKIQGPYHSRKGCMLGTAAVSTVYCPSVPHLCDLISALLSRRSLLLKYRLFYWL